MLDIVLESIRSVILLGVLVFLWRVGRNSFDHSRNGWNLIIAGFGLLLFGSLVDISDNFESLNYLVIVGDTGVEAFLEKFVGFLGGGVLIALGLVLWVPSVQRLNAEISERKAAEEALQRSRDELELRVEDRTREIGEVNEILKCEISRRRQAAEALQQSEQALTERVADLEEIKRKLESKSEDLVRIADELRIARDEAERANRAKTEFLATMSHELRTPLNAVIGFSEIMRSELLGPVGSPEYTEYAKDIHVSGQHLLSLINDLLDLAKIESGRDELHEESIEVPELIRSIAALVRGRAHDAGVEIDLDFEDDLPMLRVDDRKLKQILANLLTNAIKFTESGGKVKIRSWSSLESGYVIQLIDTGIGIAPEDIPKALSQFGQVDSELSRKYEGTGLGLPLTKALVELHGGSFDLQSELGAGTTVTVRFPASRIELSGQDQIYTGTDGRKVIGGLRG